MLGSLPLSSSPSSPIAPAKPVMRRMSVADMRISLRSLRICSTSLKSTMRNQSINNILRLSARCLQLSQQNTSSDESNFCGARLLLRLSSDRVTNLFTNFNTSLVSDTICQTQS
ncbi:hypothetical protein KCU90_g176, partial [Aureobasidium melanogenum]